MMQAEKVLRVSELIHLIINRVYYKFGQLQSLVRALKGKWQTTVVCKFYAKFRRLVD